MADERTKDWTVNEMLANALRGVGEAELREIVTKLILESLLDYDVKDIVRKVAEPVTRKLVGELLADESVLAAVREKARVALLAAKVEVSTPRY